MRQLVVSVTRHDVPPATGAPRAVLSSDSRSVEMTVDEASRLGLMLRAVGGDAAAV